MERRVAERFAATAASGLTVEDARRVVAEFLRTLGACSACDDDGQLRFVHAVRLPIDDANGTSQGLGWTRPGTNAPCPRCSQEGDPDHVRWICLCDEGRMACTAARESGDQRHEACGLRLVLPYLRSEEEKDGG